MTLGKANTQFPAFNLTEYLSEEAGGSGDEDASVGSQSSKYRTKEDQDVAVFMQIAERMSIQQLTHLLQGSARTKNNLPPLPPTPKVSTKTKAASPTETKPTSHKKRSKQFRFAEITGGAVRCVVHEIQSYKRTGGLWWTDEEMLQIRRNAIDTVKHFRKHRLPAYALAVETVATSKDKRAVESSMKLLVNDSFARGLEVHIVSLLSQTRSDTVAAVLEEQKECRLCNDSYELTGESLRGQSLAYSATSRTFALQMGGCDQIEALKATLSVWEPEEEEELPGTADDTASSPTTKAPAITTASGSSASAVKAK